MFCINCGTKLPDNSNYCPKCGKRIIPVDKSPIIEKGPYPEDIDTVETTPIDERTQISVVTTVDSEATQNKEDAEQRIAVHPIRVLLILAVLCLSVMIILLVNNKNLAEEVIAMCDAGEYLEAYKNVDDVKFQDMLIDDFHRTKISLIGGMLYNQNWAAEREDNDSLKHTLLCSGILSGLGNYEIAENAGYSNEVFDIMVVLAQKLANCGVSVEEMVKEYVEDPENQRVEPLRTENPDKLLSVLKDVLNEIDQNEVNRVKRQREKEAQKEYNRLHPLKLSQTSFRRDGDYYYTSSTVSNVGDRTIDYIRVKVIYYDAKDTVLTTDWTYAVASEGLRPNENQQFEVMTKVNGTVSSVTVQILSYE